MIHALSFDLEEWYHSDLLIPLVKPEERVSQVRQAMRPILDLLQRTGVRATFFTVGEVARDHPDLIQELVAGGHEIACHTMTHPDLWRLTEASLAEEIEQYRKAIQQAVPGQEVLGFRAPRFSLDQRTHWVLGVLRDAGYRYDSSVFPFRMPWYGIGRAPLAMYRASLQDPSIVDDEAGFLEFPVAVSSVGPVRIPAAGGVYLRLIPYPLFRALLRRVAKKRPFVIYVHPWETYPDTPSYPLPFVERFGLSVNIRHTLNRLERLIADFSFAPVREVLDV